MRTSRFSHDRVRWLGLASGCMLVSATAAAAQCDQWAPLAQGIVGQAHALAIYDNTLYVGGAFSIAGGIPASNIAAWDGAAWIPVGALNESVNALSIYEGELIAGGRFTSAGGEPAWRIAAWNGASWQAVGFPFNGPEVFALAVHDDRLIAGGFFPGMIAASDGTSWEVVGAGFSHPVLAITSWSGRMIAGGEFNIHGQGAGIAEWDGSTWQILGGGVFNGNIRALNVYDGKLIAAGAFQTIGAQSIFNIAAWDGAAWQPLGDGIDNTVHALTVYQDELIAAGAFWHAGGIAAPNIAAWNGEAWRPLGSSLNHAAQALAVYSHELIAGGIFTVAGGQAASRIAAWQGCDVPCYADCDGNTLLNIDDFTCFINEFAFAYTLAPAQQVTHYANCDNSTAVPILNVDDFTCFINAFSAGCP